MSRNRFRSSHPPWTSRRRAANSGLSSIPMSLRTCLSMAVDTRI